MTTSEKIERRELLDAPHKFGVQFGRSPQSQIAQYERAGLVPQCVTIGGTGRGDARKGYYPPVILEMLRDIRHFQKYQKFPGIRQIFDEKYRRVFELMDVIELFRLRYLSRDVLGDYLDRSSLTPTQQGKILQLFEADHPHKELKLAMLDMLGRLNIKSEANLITEAGT